MLAEVSARRNALAGGHGRGGRSGGKGRGNDGGRSTMLKEVRGGCLVIAHKKRRRQIHEIGNSGIPNCESRRKGSGQLDTMR